MTQTQMKTLIDIKRDEGRFDIWRVTFNGKVLGDSRGYSKTQAEQEARSLVSSDTQGRTLGLLGRSPKLISRKDNS